MFGRPQLPERLLASILNKYLSEYIDDVDYNNIKLGIFSGTLELSNVKIKPSALVSSARIYHKPVRSSKLRFSYGQSNNPKHFLIQKSYQVAPN